MPCAQAYFDGIEPRSGWRESDRGSVCRGDFLEVSGDQLTQSFEGFICLLAFRCDGNDRAVTCSEHHEPKDALTINFIVIFLDTNVAGKGIGDFHKLRGWASVDSELIGDGKILLRHKNGLVARP